MFTNPNTRKTSFLCRQKTIFTESEKKAILRKLEPPFSYSIAKVAESAEIPESLLHQWITKARTSRLSKSDDSKQVVVLRKQSTKIDYKVKRKGNHLELNKTVKVDQAQSIEPSATQDDHTEEEKKNIKEPEHRTMSPEFDLEKVYQNKIHSNTSTLNIQTLCREIDAALNEGQGGIQLQPHYQRDYKFKKTDESFLIESLFMNIPIPTIYLASDTTKFPHVNNVIDGQHRLRAIHRFVNNKYKLIGLETLTEMNGFYFKDLSPILKSKLLVQTSIEVNYIHVQNDPELELEIFMRYNRGTNPMTRQEIRHVLFGSKFNEWVTNELIERLEEDKVFIDAFKINKGRIINKTLHADLLLMLYILNFGLNKKFFTPSDYVEALMIATKDMNEIEVDDFIHETVGKVDKMLSFITCMRGEGIKHIFSKEIYAPKEKRMGLILKLVMVVTATFKMMLEKDLYDEKNGALILKAITSGIRRSAYPKVERSVNSFALVSNTANSIIKQLELSKK